MTHRQHGEQHRMQRVAGRKAVAVERRHHAFDADQPDERPLPHQLLLQELVYEQAGGSGDQHLRSDHHTLGTAQQRHQRHQHVPEYAIAEAAHRLEHGAQGPPARRGIRKNAQPSLEAIGMAEECCDRHAAEFSAAPATFT